jgi:dUTP pyrophosphatase
MGMVCPRSGLAAKHGLTVLNAPGIIDSDYRGEVKVVLINHSSQEYLVKIGDRIAQLILSPAPQAAFKVVEELTDTDRGAGGFGSTGR